MQPIGVSQAVHVHGQTRDDYVFRIAAGKTLKSFG